MAPGPEDFFPKGKIPFQGKFMGKIPYLGHNPQQHVDNGAKNEKGQTGLLMIREAGGRGNDFPADNGLIKDDRVIASRPANAEKLVQPGGAGHGNQPASKEEKTGNLKLKNFWGPLFFHYIRGLR